MICGIYKITNLINDKVYIGQSVNIEKRWREHKYWAKKQSEVDFPLYRAMRKYGIENFSFEVAEECSQELLDERETYYIKKI